VFSQPAIHLRASAATASHFRTPNACVAHAQLKQPTRHTQPQSLQSPTQQQGESLARTSIALNSSRPLMANSSRSKMRCPNSFSRVDMNWAPLRPGFSSLVSMSNEPLIESRFLADNSFSSWASRDRQEAPSSSFVTEAGSRPLAFRLNSDAIPHGLQSERGAPSSSGAAVCRTLTERFTPRSVTLRAVILCCPTQPHRVPAGALAGVGRAVECRRRLASSPDGRRVVPPAQLRFTAESGAHPLQSVRLRARMCAFSFSTTTVWTLPVPPLDRNHPENKLPRHATADYNRVSLARALGSGLVPLDNPAQAQKRTNAVA